MALACSKPGALPRAVSRAACDSQRSKRLTRPGSIRSAPMAQSRQPAAPRRTEGCHDGPFRASRLVRVETMVVSAELIPPMGRGVCGSGTLGILNLCAPNLQLRPSEIDQNAGRTITSNGKLELYHELWQE